MRFTNLRGPSVTGRSQPKNIPASKIIRSSVKTSWVALSFKRERRRSVRQRLTACGWEETRAEQTDVWPLYDWSFYRPLPPRHAAKIRELGGSLAHICHV